MLASLIANPLEAVINTINGGQDSAAAAPVEPQGNATFTEDVLRMMMYNLFQGDSRLQQQVLQDYYAQDVAFSLNGDFLQLTGRDEMQQLLRGTQLLASYKPEILEISSNATKAVILMKLNVSYKMLPLTWWAPVHVTTTVTLHFADNPNLLAAAAADHAHLIVGHHQELSVVDLFWWNPAGEWLNKKIWSRISGRTLAAVYHVEEPVVTKFCSYLDGGAGLIQATLWSLEDFARAAGLQGLPSAAVKLQLIPSRANSAAAAAAAAAPATAADTLGFTEAPKTPTKTFGSAAPAAAAAAPREAPAAATAPREAPAAAAAGPEKPTATESDAATGFVDNTATAALPSAAAVEAQKPDMAAAVAAALDEDAATADTAVGKTRWDEDTDRTAAAPPAAAAPDMAAAAAPDTAAAAAPDTAAAAPDSISPTRWDEAGDSNSSSAAAAAESLPVADPPTAAISNAAGSSKSSNAAARDDRDDTQRGTSVDTLSSKDASKQADAGSTAYAEAPLPAAAAADSTTALAAAVAAGLEQVTEEVTAAAAGDATSDRVGTAEGGDNTVQFDASPPPAAAVDQAGSTAADSSSSTQESPQGVALEAKAAEVAGLKVDTPPLKQQQQHPTLQRQGSSKGSRKYKHSSSKK